MLSPRALVLRAPGTNCDHETAHAFERAGGIARRVHVRALVQRPTLADDFQIFCIPGGFSYGDDIASGRILALELRTRLAETLLRFRDRGGIVLGICNGFQVLTETGLLHNASGRFVARWVGLNVVPGRSVLLQGLGGLELPVAHGEGRFVPRSAADLARLEAGGQLVLRYAGVPHGEPANPNGSALDVAGACDTTGRVLGMMPHPERFIEATQHPAWMGRLDADAPGAGLAIFANALKAAS